MDGISRFSKSYDEALLVKEILGKLNAGSLITFADRLRTQKIQYFAQLFGVSPNYRFNLYIRGPYSPELANDMYRLAELKVAKTSRIFISESLNEKFIKLGDFIKDKNIRQLELISTFHWIRKVALLPLPLAETKFIELKEPTQSELEYAKTEVEKLP